MNKKNILIVIAVTISVIVSAVTVVYALNNEKELTTIEQNKNNATYKAAIACNLLTLDDAKTILGASAVLTMNENVNGTPNESISECSYSNDETDLSALRVVSVSARSALNKDGQDGIESAFESTNGSIPAAGNEVVSDYGDKALWDSVTHRLSILKGNVWLRIGHGGSDQTTHTLEDTKKVADLVLKKQL